MGKSGKSVYIVSWHEHRSMTVIANDNNEALRISLKRKSEAQEPFLTESMSAFSFKKGEDL